MTMDEDKLQSILQDIIIAVISKSDWYAGYRYDLLKEIESIFIGLKSKQPKSKGVNNYE